MNLINLSKIGAAAGRAAPVLRGVADLLQGKGLSTGAKRPAASGSDVNVFKLVINIVRK